MDINENKNIGDLIIFLLNSEILINLINTPNSFLRC